MLVHWRVLSDKQFIKRFHKKQLPKPHCIELPCEIHDAMLPGYELRVETSIWKNSRGIYVVTRTGATGTNYPACDRALDIGEMLAPLSCPLTFQNVMGLVEVSYCKQCRRWKSWDFLMWQQTEVARASYQQTRSSCMLFRGW